MVNIIVVIVCIMVTARASFTLANMSPVPLTDGVRNAIQPMTGNFDRKEGLPNRVPTKEQEESFKWLYRDIIKRHPQLTSDKVIPHRKLQKKSCYGYNLSDTYGQELAKKAVMDSIPELKDNTPEAKALCLSIEQTDQLKSKVNNKEVLGLFALIKKLFK